MSNQYDPICMTYQPSYCAYMIKVPLEHIKHTGCKKIDMHRKLWQMMANHGTYSRSWNSIVSKCFKQLFKQGFLWRCSLKKKWGAFIPKIIPQIRPFEYWNQWRLGIRSRLLRFHPRTGGGLAEAALSITWGIRNGDCMACWDFKSKLGLSLS